MSSRRKRLRQRERRIGHAEATARETACRARWATASRNDLSLIRRAIREDWDSDPATTRHVINGLADGLNAGSVDHLIRTTRLLLFIEGRAVQAERATLAAAQVT